MPLPETFETALLKTKEITPDALCVCFTMQMAANPNGVIDMSVDEFRRFSNRVLDGRRMQTSTLESAWEELEGKGLIPGRFSVLPMAGTYSEFTEEEVASWVKRKRQLATGMPDRSAEEKDPEMMRMAYGLKGFSCEAVCQTNRVHFVEDESGSPVLVNGHKKKYTRREWDWSKAFALLKAGKRGRPRTPKSEAVDNVIEAAYTVKRNGTLDNMPDSFDKRRRQIGKYIRGVLKSGNTASVAGDTESLFDDNNLDGY